MLEEIFSFTENLHSLSVDQAVESRDVTAPTTLLICRISGLVDAGHCSCVSSSVSTSSVSSADEIVEIFLGLLGIFFATWWLVTRKLSIFHSLASAAVLQFRMVRSGTCNICAICPGRYVDNRIQREILYSCC